MNPNIFLENIHKKIKISQERQKYIRGAVKKIFNKFSEIDTSCYGYRFGGGFKRYTSIRNYFDVDVLFIGDFQKQNLLKNFENRLKKLQANYNSFNIASPPPYLHAIPALFNSDIELDCLAAIKLSNGQFIIIIVKGDKWR